MPSFLFPNRTFYPRAGVNSFEYPNHSFYPRSTDNSFLSGDGTFFKSTSTGGPEPSGAATLVGGRIANPASLLTSLKIANASFAITVNGTVQQVGPLNLTAATDLVSIATTIGNNIAAAGCEWLGNRFAIATDAVGPTQTISFAAAPAAGTDISALCALTAATGAVVTAGFTPREVEDADHGEHGRRSQEAGVRRVQGAQAALR